MSNARQENRISGREKLNIFYTIASSLNNKMEELEAKVLLALGGFCPASSQHLCSLFLSYFILYIYLFINNSLYSFQFLLFLLFHLFYSLFSLSLSISLRRSEFLQKVFCKAHLAAPGCVSGLSSSS